MSTQSWSTVIQHGSDAQFRTWGSELNTKLTAAGLVQTGDTGQINWTTVTRPGTNTTAGYEIWKLNDSLFATAPVYFRINYGTGGATGTPRIQIQVGTATDGAGTLSGVTTTASNLADMTSDPDSSATPQSYLCVTEAFFGLFWKTQISGTNTVNGSFYFCRTCDVDGTPDARGGFCMWGNSNTAAKVQSLRFVATAVAYTAASTSNNAAAFVPWRLGNSAVAGDTQAFNWWVQTPRIEPIFGLCTIFTAEISPGSTFTVAMVGTATHTFIALKPGGGTSGSTGGAGHANAADSPAANVVAVAMLWE